MYCRKITPAIRRQGMWRGAVWLTVGSGGRNSRKRSWWPNQGTGFGYGTSEQIEETHKGYQMGLVVLNEKGRVGFFLYFINTYFKTE